MKAILESCLQLLGLIVLLIAVYQSLKVAWAIWMAARERRRERTERLLKLLEQIETNTRSKP